jgi:hypothetical protein
VQSVHSSAPRPRLLRGPSARRRPLSPAVSKGQRHPAHRPRSTDEKEHGSPSRWPLSKNSTVRSTDHARWSVDGRPQRTPARTRYVCCLARPARHQRRCGLIDQCHVSRVDPGGGLVVCARLGLWRCGMPAAPVAVGCRYRATLTSPGRPAEACPVPASATPHQPAPAHWCVNARPAGITRLLTKLLHLWVDVLHSSQSEQPFVLSHTLKFVT